MFTGKATLPTHQTTLQDASLPAAASTLRCRCTLGSCTPAGASTITASSLRCCCLTCVWEAHNADISDHPQQQLQPQLLTRQPLAVILPVDVLNRNNLAT